MKYLINPSEVYTSRFVESAVLFLDHLHACYAKYALKYLVRYCLYFVFSGSVITPYAAVERIMLSRLCKNSTELQSGA